MLFSRLACAAALTAVVSAANNNKGATGAANNDAASGTTLLANAIQTGSTLDGSQEIGADEVGQAKSLTSNNNFINICSGKTLTNGLQITTGSCNGIPMGDIPPKTNMVSSVILFPETNGQQIQADTTFNISVQMLNFVAGSFTNADATYYAAPQQLQGNNIVGHTHVTVQDLGKSLNPAKPLDPTQFAFFKGINDAGNGQLLLQAEVTGGLPAGNYRVCTLASSSNHQPVLMPVAQRGTSDDCTKFVVSGNGNVANAAANSGSKGIAAAAAAQSAVDAGPAFIDTTTAAAAAAATGKGAANDKGAAANASATKAAANASASASSKGNANVKGGAANASSAKGAANASATAQAKGSANANQKGNADAKGQGQAQNGKQGRRARREFIS